MSAYEKALIKTILTLGARVTALERLVQMLCVRSGLSEEEALATWKKARDEEIERSQLDVTDTHPDRLPDLQG